MAEHTPGPWVGFDIDGKLDAIMPAGRDGDVCTFRQPPSDADARLIMAAPALLTALKELVYALEIDVEWDDGSLDEARAALKNAEPTSPVASADRATLEDK